MSATIDLEKFYDCFVQALGVDRDDLDMDKTLLEDLGADSLDLLDLVFNLEQAFNIQIPRGEPFGQEILRQHLLFPHRSPGRIGDGQGDCKQPGGQESVRAPSQAASSSPTAWP